MKHFALLITLIPLLGNIYVFWRIWYILPLSSGLKTAILALLSLGLICLFLNFLVDIDRLPMPLATGIYEVGTSWIIILLYMFMLFLLLDIGRLVHLVPSSFMINSVKGSVSVAVFIVALFVYANLNYVHKVRQSLDLTTTKHLEKSMKIVMISDLHLGYHNRKGEFERWIRMINAEHPDLILIAGDIIDRSMRPLIEQNMAADFHRFNAPVYACLGNHEYYSGEPKSLKFFEDAGIHLLRDSVVTVNGINIVGRDDRANRNRASLYMLMQGVDMDKYTILLDHQPYNLGDTQANHVDFQLSGHTHYGQVWPISWIEDRLYEKAYGALKKGDTQYFVTSGMGIWGAKFRIGTHSEYVVATLHNN